MRWVLVSSLWDEFVNFQHCPRGFVSSSVQKHPFSLCWVPGPAQWNLDSLLRAPATGGILNSLPICREWQSHYFYAYRKWSGELEDREKNSGLTFFKSLHNWGSFASALDVWIWLKLKSLCLGHSLFKKHTEKGMEFKDDAVTSNEAFVTPSLVRFSSISFLY